jgi:hypothetical protein
MNTRTVAAVVLLLVLFCGAGYFLSQNSSESNEPSTKEFVLRVENGRLVTGASTLTVRQGDAVNIKITSDETEEFHLHGYDRSIDLEPGIESTLMFVADASGHFVYELEHSKVEIGALDVLP